MNPFSMTCGHCAPGQRLPGRSEYARARGGRLAHVAQAAVYRGAFGQGDEDEEDELLNLFDKGNGQGSIYVTKVTPYGAALVTPVDYQPTVQGYLQAYDVGGMMAAPSASSSHLTLVRRPDAAGNALSYLPVNGSLGAALSKDVTTFPDQLQMIVTDSLNEAVNAFGGASSIIIAEPVGGWADAPGTVLTTALEETADKVAAVANGVRLGSLIGGVIAVGGLFIYSRRGRR